MHNSTRTLPYAVPTGRAFLKVNPLTFDNELCEVGDASTTWGLGHTTVQILLCAAYRGQWESGQKATVADVPHPCRRHQHPTLPLQEEAFCLCGSACCHALEGRVLARIDLHISKTGEVRGLCCGKTGRAPA